MRETHVAEPEKLVRITTMARAMLVEARSAPCDVAGCERLRRIHDRVIAELSDVVSADLYEELLTLSVRFEEVSPTPSEVRVAQAELVGWLEGLLAGVLASAGVSPMDVSAETTGDATQTLAEDPMPGLYL
ncbi:MAG: proteasome activator [Actinomycetota bacterium]|nr:proteasome activator [Actinomycetota bacterium]